MFHPCPSVAKITPPFFASFVLSAVNFPFIFTTKSAKDTKAEGGARMDRPRMVAQGSCRASSVQFVFHPCQSVASSSKTACLHILKTHSLLRPGAPTSGRLFFAFRAKGPPLYQPAAQPQVNVECLSRAEGPAQCRMTHLMNAV